MLIRGVEYKLNWPDLLDGKSSFIAITVPKAEFVEALEKDVEHNNIQQHVVVLDSMEKGYRGYRIFVPQPHEFELAGIAREKR